jgi:hypothetical protein
VVEFDVGGDFDSGGAGEYGGGGGGVGDDAWAGGGVSGTAVAAAVGGLDSSTIERVIIELMFRHRAVVL